MKIKIATPVSHLFAKPNKHLDEVIALSDILELRDIKTGFASDKIKLYHCESSLLNEWGRKELEKIAGIINSNNILFASFHLASCYQIPRIEKTVFFPGKKRMAENEMIENAGQNLKRLKKMLKKKIVIAVENNNYFPTGAYETVTDSRFMNLLSQKFDLKIVMDIGHAEITAFNKKMDFDDYIRSFRFEMIYQFHLSGIKKEADSCEDAHNRLRKKGWDCFSLYYPMMPELRYGTLEYYKNIKTLSAMLQMLKANTAG